MRFAPVAFGLTLELMVWSTMTGAQTLDRLWQQEKRTPSARSTKEYADEERFWRQVIQRTPNDAVAFSNLCNALFGQNKLDEARDFCQKSLELNPKYAPTYNVLGNILYRQKKLEKAIERYRKALELDPNFADAYNNLGNALRDQNKLEEAIEKYRKAIAIDPDLVDAYNGLGNILRDQNKLEDAIEQYRTALRVGDRPGSITTAHTLVHNNLGRLFQEQGKLEDAIAEFEKATRTDPTFEFAQNNLREARRLLALQQQPEQIVALNNTRYLPKDDPLTPIERSIVKISSVFTGNAKGTAYGTGYVIKRKGATVWIITNRHVVVDRETEQRGDNLEIEPYYGRPPQDFSRSRVSARIVKITGPKEQLDLALLEVTGLPEDIQPLASYKGTISPNMSILIIGHPESKDWSRYEATISGIQSSSGNLLLDVNLNVGASGSPVLDRNMRVVGLMFIAINASQINTNAIGVAHPIDKILQQLAQWNVAIP